MLIQYLAMQTKWETFKEFQDLQFGMWAIGIIEADLESSTFMSVLRQENCM